jgi:hypothetical protein
MKIYELLDRDPRTGRLANGGQARILDIADSGARAELRAELESFVCDGQFGDALQRILDRFLANLGTPRQDSAWVSGFFGSGKSHLLKMITHLWVNTAFDDGANARSLVRGGLPDEVEAQLRELDTHARRTGRPAVAAAGSMLGGIVDRVRETVLSILLQATGWPSQYSQAMFCFWLRKTGHLGQIRRSVEAAGKEWFKELGDLHVSPVIARALIQADPDFAVDEKAARQVLIRQFPQRNTDISTLEFVAAAKEALSPDATLPLTILVLDEVQQYINEDTDRAAAITELAEALQTQFDSRVMLVGAGQSALSAGTHSLMWLRDRFRIAVELTDADVEAVTRRVLLQKKPTARPEIEAAFEINAGEIARHLQGTKIGSRSDDRKYRVEDYPLLPVRRRFWEACFQAADAPGTHSQLRSQLRILHDSLHAIANQGLGAAIPASDLFDALAPSLVNSGVLLNEINTRIQKLNDGTEAGRLRRDVCGIVFLVGKLPKQEGVDLGIRANANTIADLLVSDISKDSGSFRKLVSDTLDGLATEGVLMKVGEEFRLQTTEGAEWDRAFRERQQGVRGNEPEISARRDQLFGKALQDILNTVKLIHGEAKIRRTIVLHVANEAPQAGGDHISVWLRDGWACSQKDAERDARRVGQDDPTLHVFLPKRSDDRLRDRIIDVEAARQVIDRYGTPSSPEGREAQESMASRLGNAEAARDEIVRDVLRAASAFQGGGNELFGDDLAAKINAGAQASLARLFPRFDEGDHKAWEAAVKRARDGSDQPLKVVGWDGATEEHPVAREILQRATSPVKGSEIHRALKAAPCGWPQDAIDAVLTALHRSGHLRATKNGQAVAPGSLDQTALKTAEFRAERIRIPAGDRIALRGLFSKVGISCKTGEEEQRAPQFLDALVNLADRTGGAPPLPAPADTRSIDDLRRLVAAEQLSAILARKAELEASIGAWLAIAQHASARREEWDLAVALRQHAGGLAGCEEAGRQLDAITAQRSLLDETNHGAPVVAMLAGALRTAVSGAHAGFVAAVQSARQLLEGDATWQKLNDAQQTAILRSAGLDVPFVPRLGTNDELRRSLDARSLLSWSEQADAVPQRTTRALAAAAAVVEPTKQTTTVLVRRGTLATEVDVRAWLVEHERRFLEAVRTGPVIVS